MNEPLPEPVIVRISVPLAAWLLEHNKSAVPTIVGLTAMGSMLIWAPWWGRLIGILGIALTLLGIELENLAHRIDGANTMMHLMEEHHERKR